MNDEITDMSPLLRAAGWNGGVEECSACEPIDRILLHVEYDGIARCSHRRKEPPVTVASCDQEGKR